MYDYRDAYIVVAGRIIIEGTKFFENAEDFDIVMPIYNLLEYSDNYSITSGSLWNYYREESIDDASEINESGDYTVNKNKQTTNKSFVEDKNYRKHTRW